MGWQISSDRQSLVEFSLVESARSRAGLPKNLSLSEGQSALSPAVRQRIEAFLRAVPEIAREVDSLQGGWYQLSFSPAVWRQIRLGNAEIIRSGDHICGIARDTETGRFISVGKLVPVSAATKLMSGMWQVASVVTFQQYLQTINSQLAQIQSGVDALRTLLRSEQIGILTSSRIYLEQLVASLTSTPISQAELDDFVSKVETNEKEMIAMFESARIRLDSNLSMLRSRQAAKSRLSEDQYQAQMRDISDDLSVASAAISVRVMGAQVGMLLPISHQRLAHRLENATSKIADLQEHQNELYAAGLAISPELNMPVRHWGRLVSKVTKDKINPNAKFNKRIAYIHRVAQTQSSDFITAVDEIARRASQDFAKSKALTEAPQNFFVRLDDHERILDIRQSSLK